MRMHSDLITSYNYGGVSESFATDLNRIEDAETESESMRYKALWGAVILQAIIDITSNYKRTENNIEKMKARSWIQDLHVDFITVCHYAGYDPEFVKNKMKTATPRSKVKKGNINAAS